MVSVISGYFQAASFGLEKHPGYVEYFTSAAKDADTLIVVVQSVTQQYKKYGPLARPLHSKSSRKYCWYIEVFSNKV